MIINEKKITETFDEYTSHYNRQDEKVRLKYEHTYRVADLCKEIAHSLSLVEEDAEFAWLLGMLHDIGRFEQLKQYGTFIDAKSVDHASLGIQILFEQNKIKDYVDASEKENELIQTAIGLHSVYRLPENLDDRTRVFCQILRDADKIDILKVNVDFPLEEIFNVSTDELKSSTVDSHVMAAFMEEHAVLHSLKKTAVDYVVGHLSLFYELVYPRSREITLEQGYLDKLLNFESNNAYTREQFQQIRQKMIDKE